MDKDLDLKNSKKKKETSKTIHHVRIAYEDQFAVEIMNGVVQKTDNLNFRMQTPRCYGFYTKTTCAAFYTKIIRYNFKLCPISDVYGIMYHKEKIGEGRFYLGMIPLECSDGGYRILTFKIDRESTLRIGTVLADNIDNHSMFLLRS